MIPHRIRIFEQWDLPATPAQYPSEEPQRAAQRPLPSKRADSLLNEAQLLLCNVGDFLEQRRRYVERRRGSEEGVANLLGKLHEHCGNQREDAASHQSLAGVLLNDLEKLYTALRGLRLLEREIKEYFQLANLTNYDPTQTQPVFTKTAAEVEAELQLWQERLLLKMATLREGLGAAESGANISGGQTLQRSVQQLEDELSHAKMVELHLLMLAELASVDREVEELKEVLRVGEAEYLKYELVYDCLCLMKNQQREMTTLRQQMQEEQNRKVKGDFQEHEDESEQDLEARAIRNLGIYNSNLNIFTRVEAEISMYFYAKSRTDFVRSLQDYDEFLQTWRSNRKQLKRIIDFRTMLSSIQTDAAYSTVDIQQLTRSCRALHACVTDLSVPTQSSPVSEAKGNLIRDIEAFMKSKNILYTQQWTAETSLAPQCMEFFKEFRRQPQSNQKAFLLKNQFGYLEHKVQQKQEAGKLTRSESEELERLARGLKYVFNVYLLIPILGVEEIEEKLSEEGDYLNLPDGVHQYLLNRTRDIYLLRQAIKSWKNKTEQLTLLTDQLKSSAHRLKNRFGMDKLVEEFLHPALLQLHGLYDRWLRRVSAVSEAEMWQCILLFLSQIGGAIAAAMPEEGSLYNKNSLSIDRQYFYTLASLSELKKNVDEAYPRLQNIGTSSLLIVNIEAVLKYMFDLIDSEFITGSTALKSTHLLRLAMLLRYLSIYNQKKMSRSTNQVSPDQTFPNYSGAVRTIIMAGWLQLMAELTLEKETSQPSDCLPLLLHLQQQAAKLHPDLLQDETKPFMEEQILRLIREMREPSLTLAARHDISGMSSVFDLQYAFNELNTVRQDNSTLSASRVYGAMLILSEAQRTTTIPYYTYENIVVRKRKSVQRSFTELAAQAKRQLEGKKEGLIALERHFAGEGDLWRAVKLAL